MPVHHTHSAHQSVANLTLNPGDLMSWLARMLERPAVMRALATERITPPLV